MDCLPSYSLSKQVYSSLSKNLVPISLITNDVTMKPRELGLIIKKCKAAHTKYLFKIGFILQQLINETYNSGRKLF